MIYSRPITRPKIASVVNPDVNCPVLTPDKLPIPCVDCDFDYLPGDIIDVCTVCGKRLCIDLVIQHLTNYN